MPMQESPVSSRTGAVPQALTWAPHRTSTCKDTSP